MKWTKRYRKQILTVITVFCMIGFIYLAIQTSKIKDVHVKMKVFSGKAMGTVVKKTLYVEDETKSDAINKKIDACLNEVESQLSVRVPDSEIAKCNRNYAVDGVYTLPEDIMGYLKKEMEISRESKGAFSPCIRPLAELWGIEEGKTTVPTENDIRKTLENTSNVNFEIVENGVIFHTDKMAIDFGATGKGIACDKVIALLAEEEVEGAVVSVGGNVAVYGDKGDHKKWHIGIQDPRGKEGEYLGVVDVSGNTVIATSGDYEKYFEEGGKRYHHILDPATGYPAENGLISVTIISDDGFMADALSTTCFVMGLKRGMEYAEQKGVEAIFVTKEKEVYITKGIKKSFYLQSEQYKLAK